MDSLIGEGENAMRDEETARQAPPRSEDGENDVNDLNVMLQELRILQQGVQVLTGFLVILPFSTGFAHVQRAEKWDYLATFVCSVSSLVLFSAPAAQHRLERPVRNLREFDQFATRMTIAGLVLLSLALILATHLVVAEVMGSGPAIGLGLLVAVLVGVFWWLLPWSAKKRSRR
jgi:Family of unknown function (DUF6328)